MSVVELSDLSEPERLVWDAFPRGAWVDLRSGDPHGDDLGSARGWGPERVVRAGVLRALLLGAREAEPGFAPGVRLRGALVRGRLDLMGATASCPLVCEYCWFDGEVRLVESSVRTVRIVKSRVPGLNATRMRLAGIFSLWCSTVAGPLRLDEAKVAGHMYLSGAEVGAGGGAAEAVAARGLSVDGGLEGAGLTAHGAVSLRAARITGAVDLRDARVSNPGGMGLAADYAQIGGSLACRGVAVEGETSLHNTRVAAAVVFTGAELKNPAGEALSAGGMIEAAGCSSVTGSRPWVMSGWWAPGCGRT